MFVAQFDDSVFLADCCDEVSLGIEEAEFFAVFLDVVGSHEFAVLAMFELQEVWIVLVALEGDGVAVAVVSCCASKHVIPSKKLDRVEDPEIAEDEQDVDRNNA